MSQPKRLSDNKEWILLGHYAEAMERVVALETENARLRKAGDAMAFKIPRMIARQVTTHEAIYLLEEWKFAKEAQQ